MGAPELEIVIPVYNEGASIIRVLTSLARSVRTPFRVLIVYDHDADDTLPAIRGAGGLGLAIVPVKNPGRGPHTAVCAGFQASTAPAVLVFPADDTTNAGMIDTMVTRCAEGYDIVAASRFMPGGRMVGCPWLKAVLVRTANWTLRHLTRLPTHDASNGFRLFSRRVLDQLTIESTEGFTYSLELLVKCHRLGWRITEVPTRWFERRPGQGKSRFRVLRWLPAYLRWYAYAFATTYLRRGPRTVSLRGAPTTAAPVSGAGVMSATTAARRAGGQDKTTEIAVFAEYAKDGEFNMLTDRTREQLIRRCLAMAGLRPGARVWDLGCGSGAFTVLLRRFGLDAVGLDLCHPLTAVGRSSHPKVPFVVGDVEYLPVRSESLDGVLLSGLIHHFPDPAGLAREAFRVLRPGGVFMAFDPNRRNPLMWLYRDHDSPFYSSRGVSPNERPILVEDVARIFGEAGFVVRADYLSPAYRTIASSALRWALPVYNALEAVASAPSPLRAYRAFVLTAGTKPGPADQAGGAAPRISSWM